MRALLPLTAALALAACDPPAPKSSDRPADLAEASCTATETPLALDAAAPDGQVPDALLAAVPTSIAATFYYLDGARSTVAFALDAAAASAVWVDEELDGGADTGATPADAVVCTDRVRITAPFAFTTADGAFDLAGTITLDAASNGSLAGDFTAAPAQFGGDHDWGTDLGEDPLGSLSVLLIADGETTAGGIDLLTFGTDGDVAWAERTPVGGWATPE